MVNNPLKWMVIVIVADILCFIGIVVHDRIRAYLDGRKDEESDHPDILTLHEHAMMLGFDAAGNMVWKLGQRYYHTLTVNEETRVVSIDRALAIKLCRESACA